MVTSHFTSLNEISDDSTLLSVENIENAEMLKRYVNNSQPNVYAVESLISYNFVSATQVVNLLEELWRRANSWKSWITHKFQTHKHKHTNTNTQIQTHKNKYTNTNTQIQHTNKGKQTNHTHILEKSLKTQDVNILVNILPNSWKIEVTCNSHCTWFCVILWSFMISMGMFRCIGISRIFCD